MKRKKSVLHQILPPRDPFEHELTEQIEDENALLAV